MCLCICVYVLLKGYGVCAINQTSSVALATVSFITLAEQYKLNIVLVMKRIIC